MNNNNLLLLIIILVVVYVVYNKESKIDKYTNSVYEPENMNCSKNVNEELNEGLNDNVSYARPALKPYEGAADIPGVYFRKTEAMVNKDALNDLVSNARGVANTIKDSITTGQMQLMNSENSI